MKEGKSHPNCPSEVKPFETAHTQPQTQGTRGTRDAHLRLGATMEDGQGDAAGEAAVVAESLLPSPALLRKRHGKDLLFQLMCKLLHDALLRQDGADADHYRCRHFQRERSYQCARAEEPRAHSRHVQDTARQRYGRVQGRNLSPRDSKRCVGAAQQERCVS